MNIKIENLAIIIELTSPFELEKGLAEMVDYEALGKYTEGKDKLGSILMERDKILRELDQLTGAIKGISLSTGIVARLNVEKAKELVENLIEAEKEINSAVAQINAYADKCGKKKVDLR